MPETNCWAQSRCMRHQRRAESSSRMFGSNFARVVQETDNGDRMMIRSTRINLLTSKSRMKTNQSIYRLRRTTYQLFQQIIQWALLERLLKSCHRSMQHRAKFFQSLARPLGCNKGLSRIIIMVANHQISAQKEHNSEVSDNEKSLTEQLARKKDISGEAWLNLIGTSNYEWEPYNSYNFK